MLLQLVLKAGPLYSIDNGDCGLPDDERERWRYSSFLAKAGRLDYALRIRMEFSRAET
jgi:hypothetical protein